MEADSVEQTTLSQTEDGVGGDLGEGPFHFADAATPDASTDASPEAAEVPETTAEAAMIDTESATIEPQGASPANESAWPTTGQRPDAEPEAALEQAAPTEGAAEAPVAEQAPEITIRPAVRAQGDPKATRSNPLVAGLVKAMREAALASRGETTGRLQADATAQVELLREAATARAAELRKQADEDISGIRDWSKSEVARIKAETDERIETRRNELTTQTERHEANVEYQVQQVQATVAAFEADMDRFFDELLAENDPARVAALAEQAPEPPDLAAELTELRDADPEVTTGEAETATDTETETETASEWDDVAWGGPVPPELADPEANPEAVLEAASDDAAPEAVEETATEAVQETATEAVEAAAEEITDPAPALEATAAAEAEAAASEGLELPQGDVWPSSVLAAARRTLHHVGGDFEAAGVANTRLFVNGLTSVAGISAFKGALGQLPGVRSVSVSSGEPGVFIFTVVHSPETDLQESVASLTSFSARVTDASDDYLTVVAQEPAA